MKFIFLILAILVSNTFLVGQKYFTKGGNITFESSTPIEEIKATNANASSVVDLESGDIQWAVLIKGFEFKKALMQEHFNENYMESSKFPKAKFTGNISNKELFAKNEDFTASIKGELEIHGVKKEIETTATMKFQEDGFKANTTINVLVADFDIEIPKLVRENIAKEVEINIEANYKELKR